MHFRDYRNPSLRKLNAQYDQKKLDFEQVRKNWNQLVRNYLSKNMGVSLVEGDFRHQITVHIKPSMNEEFMDIIERNFPELDFQEYFILRQFVERASEAAEFFDDAKAAHHLKMSSEYAQYRLKDFDILQITKDVFKFLEPRNKDVFGCYYVDDSRVEIYVFPIVLFCQLHGLDIESFIVMVLTHELAHAYNHIGRDKDGKIWESFGGVDNEVAEGLAQYYTQKFLQHYQYRNPHFMSTFSQTLEQLPDAYKVFEKWDASLEQIYRAFIDARRNNLVDYEKFEKVIVAAKVAIR